MPGPSVVVIGGSAGGLNALRGIFQTLEGVRETVLCVVLHRPVVLDRPPDYSPLAEVLQSYTALPVHEPSSSRWNCLPGAVTVAPAGYHLLVGNSRSLSPEPSTPVAQYETTAGVRSHLTLDAPVAYSRPSLDLTFFSATELVNPVIAVLLSCANEDGAAGCEAVKAAGGRVVLQDPATCDAAAAVRAAMRRLDPDHVADPPGIGRWLSQALVS